MENTNKKTKEQNRSRNVALTFRVTEKEHELIRKKMEIANIANFRSYLLKMAIDGYVVQLDLKDVREMLTLLRNATGNLNQLTRRVNSGGGLYKADIEDLRGKYDGLWEKTDGILRQLARL